MTGLSTDLHSLVNRHQGAPADAMVEVPVGILRACLIHVARCEDSPLFDRMRQIALVGRVEVRADREIKDIAA